MIAGLALFSFRRADSPALSSALAAGPAAAWPGRLAAIAELPPASLAWVTCERAELLVAAAAPGEEAAAALREAAAAALTGDPARRAELARQGRLLRGEAAAAHLFRLAAGLDSRLLGEEEIARQLREAMVAAKTAGQLDRRLARLLGWALEAGKKARQVLAAPAIRQSWALATRALVAEQLATTRLAGAAAARIAVVGTGALAEGLAQALGSLPATSLHFYGAHPDRSHALAARHGGQGHALAALPADLAGFDVAIFATRAHTPLIGRAELAERRKEAGNGRPPLLLVDLGEPPLVAAEVAGLEGVRRVDLAALASRAAIPSAERRQAAERLLAAELARFRQRFAGGGNEALVLAAHGAGAGSSANRAIVELAGRLEKLLPGTTVEAAFRLGSPGWGEAIAAARDRGQRTTVVPLLAAEGYFARQVLPREVLAAGGSRAAIRPPLGRHAGLQQGLSDRVRLALASAPGAGLLIAAHGSRRDDGSGDTSTQLTELLRQQFPHTPLRLGFLDQEPQLEAAAAALADLPAVILLPFFLGGEHAAEDLPRRARAGLGPGPRLELLGPLLEEPMLLPALLDLAGGRAPRLRLGSRRSRLALVQVEQVRRHLGDRGIATEVVLFDTLGDRDQSRPIEALGAAGPFTDELDAALKAGIIDLAVHSLKDVPLAELQGDAGEELVLAACLPRGPASEVLVGAPLRRLPAGARIGTCSTRRALQLRQLRPDLRAVPVRGSVEQRLAQLDAGHYDALLLAEAGLTRLDLAHRIAERLPFSSFLPEPGQAVIALVARAADRATCRQLAAIDHPATTIAARAERQVARALEAEGGSVALFARCLPGPNHHGLELQARWLRPDQPAPLEVCARHREPAEAVRLTTLALRRQLAFGKLTWALGA